MSNARSSVLNNLSSVEFYTDPGYPGSLVRHGGLWTSESMYFMALAEATRKCVPSVRMMSRSLLHPFCDDDGPFLCDGIHMSRWGTTDYLWDWEGTNRE